jgi:hypothetical protein
MQPTEDIGQIFIIVIDETYGGDEDTHEEDSERYRVSLEREFDVRFEEANVGPGADIPAFLTVITATSVPLWSVLIGAFFLAKPINENLDAWADIGRKIKAFFKRPVVLARHGASVLAVEAVFDEMGGIPKSIRLLSYRPEYMGDLGSLAAIERSDEISENVPTLNLGFILHIFEIEADGQQFRVGINGKITKVLRL